MDALGYLSYQVTKTLAISGGFGFSHLTDFQEQTSQTGPSWNVSVVQRVQRATLSAGYIRSYVPSFGLGGTVQNQELDADVPCRSPRTAPTSRSGCPGARNEPLTPGELDLRSLWFQTSAGYSVHRWLRVEAYYCAHAAGLPAGGRQDRTATASVSRS